MRNNILMDKGNKKILKAADLLKTENIITCSPQDRLSSALSKLTSSHNAIFVFSEEKDRKFLGVISPYYAILASGFPPETKVENCLVSVPKLRMDTPIWQIAKHMLQSKVYFLPVFDDNDEFAGIVTIRKILKTLLDRQDLLQKLSYPIKKKPIIIAQEHEKIDKARSLLRKKHVSRLPIVNKLGRLVGILTRFDLRVAFIAPKQAQAFLSRVGEKHRFLDQPISRFYKRQVVSVSKKVQLVQIIKLMFEKEIGSIVVVDSLNRPIDIITSKDILRSLAGLFFTRQTKIFLKVDTDFDKKDIFKMQLMNFIQEVNKFTFVNSAWVDLRKKNIDRDLNKYYVSLKFVIKDNKVYMARATDFKWENTLKEAIEIMKIRLEIKGKLQ